MGAAVFKVVNLSYGISAQYKTSESAQSRVAYFYNSNNDNFVVTIQFTSWLDYANGYNFFYSYMNNVGNAENSVDPMAVVVNLPGFTFNQTGIPESGVSYGNQVGELVFTMIIPFVGTANVQTASSNIINPTQDFTISSNFYPFDPQGESPAPSVASANSGTAADALYDSALSAQLNNGGALVASAVSKLNASLSLTHPVGPNPSSPSVTNNKLGAGNLGL